MGTSLELCDCGSGKNCIRVVPEVLEVPQGTILVARVGILDLGDGLGPWIPSEEDLAYVRDELHEALPKRAVVVTGFDEAESEILVTHFGVELTVQDSTDTVDG